MCNCIMTSNAKMYGKMYPLYDVSGVICMMHLSFVSPPSAPTLIQLSKIYNNDSLSCNRMYDCPTKIIGYVPL